MPIHVQSEIGRLRRVLVHRPGREIDRMVPAMMERLLFDDILDGSEAFEEHDLFWHVLERSGVEVLNAGTLLAEVLARDEVKNQILDELEREYGAPPQALERLRDLAPEPLARALVEGLPATRSGSGGRGFFDLDPIPNYFFQRDPQVVIGDQVVISSMATSAREREPLLAGT